MTRGEPDAVEMSHVRFGGRAGETHQAKGRHGAPVRPLHPNPDRGGCAAPRRRCWTVTPAGSWAGAMSGSRTSRSSPARCGWPSVSVVPGRDSFTTPTVAVSPDSTGPRNSACRRDCTLASDGLWLAAVGDSTGGRGCRSRRLAPRGGPEVCLARTLRSEVWTYLGSTESRW